MRQNDIFLNVTHSIKGQAWRNNLDRAAENNARAIAQKYAIPEPLARIMSARGVDETEAEIYIEPTIKNLMPDPLIFLDMQKAAQRIAKAIVKKENIAIFGDYDVDGACSTAIMCRYLKHFGIIAKIYIPDRIVEGYGPNVEAMSMLAKQGASLIITVDCGANSEEAIIAAKKNGADVVVLDHHQMTHIHDSAHALVNPNRPDDQSEQGHLCAAGVVFMTIVRINRLLIDHYKIQNIPDVLQYLDMVALATICDIVPLKGINRAFVSKGLVLARQMRNIGIAKLAAAARVGEPLNSFHFGFLLGPRINAGGRIGDQALGARLLTINNENAEEAENLAQQLSELNDERQQMEAEQLAEALSDIENTIEEGDAPKIIVVASEKWHAGIVGIMAARLKERYNCPAFVIAIKEDGFGAGSGRSISGIDMGVLVHKAVASGLLEKGGGHAMAAGITIAKDKIDVFRKWLQGEIADKVDAIRKTQSLMIDGVISASGATVDFYTMIDKAGPFGAGNPVPIFVLPSHRLVSIKAIGKQQNHITMQLANKAGIQIKAIAFRSVGTGLGNFLFENIGKEIHVAGNLNLNYWNNQVSVQFNVIDAAAVQ